MTRQNILQKRVNTGWAKYEDKQIYRVTVYKEYDMRYTIKLGVSENGFTLLSIADILFGPSNFFDIIAEHLEPTMEVTMVCNELGIGRELGHKMCCVKSKDKLQYLIDNLSK